MTLIVIMPNHHSSKSDIPTRQIFLNRLKPLILSLGDQITLSFLIEKICNQIGFNQIFDPNSWNPNQSSRRN